MGCDIHIYTEKRMRNGDKEYWHCCDHFKYNIYSLDDERPELTVVEIYDGRNYELFSALADVRNEGNIDPICLPKGLPDDASPIVRSECVWWGTDGHSHSWLTAKELFTYQNRHPFTTHQGMLSKVDVEKLDECGIYPKVWCRWTNEAGAEFRKWVEPGSPVDKLVECVKKRMKEEYWICDWESEEKQEEKIWKHADDFRIVFWFDN